MIRWLKSKTFWFASFMVLLAVTILYLLSVYAISSSVSYWVIGKVSMKRNNNFDIRHHSSDCTNNKIEFVKKNRNTIDKKEKKRYRNS